MSNVTRMALPGGRYDLVSSHDRMGFPAIGIGGGMGIYHVDSIGLVVSQLLRKYVYMMPSGTIEKGLVLVILDNPDDPTLRLIYADWLDEQGRNEEAQAERQAGRWLEDNAIKGTTLQMSGE